MVGDPMTPQEIETLALLADDCLNGAECLYDPYLHEGPDDPGSEPPAERATRQQVAAEVCAGCPARKPCLEYALRARPARGVWAGLTAFEVAALADALNIPPAGEGARPQPPSTPPGTAPPSGGPAGGQLGIHPTGAAALPGMGVA
jgi:WhiB family redox-sensing transcriptional regulator